MDKEVVLYCHTEMVYDGEVWAKAGETYEVLQDDNYAYLIIDETGWQHQLTKEPDDEGISFADWFEVREID